MPQLHRLTKVKEVTGLSRSTIYALIASGKFPKPVKISTRCVAWPSEHINKWVAERIDSSNVQAS